MRKSVFFPLVLLLGLLAGCGDDGEDEAAMKRIRQENSLLRERVGHLEKSLEHLEKSLAEQRRDGEARQAILQNELAEKTLRLSALDRKALVMDEALKSGSRLERLAETGFQGERLAFLLVIIVLAAFGLHGWRRYREVLARFNQHALDKVAIWAEARETPL